MPTMILSLHPKNLKRQSPKKRLIDDKVNLPGSCIAAVGRLLYLYNLVLHVQFDYPYDQKIIDADYH